MKSEQEIKQKIEELEDKYYTSLAEGNITRTKQIEHRIWNQALNWTLGVNNDN